MKYNNLQYTNKSNIVSRLLALATFAFVSILMFGIAYVASAATLTSTIGPGSRGTNVTNLQSYLASNPSFYPEGFVTGYYGVLTTSAVQRFQAYYGIVSSGTVAGTGYGNVGPITLAKLNSLMGSTGDVSAPTISNVSVQLGSTQVVLNWNTNSNAQGRVFYDTSPLQMEEPQTDFTPPIMRSGQASQSETSFTTAHNLTISGLSPNTTYYYIVRATDQAGNVSITWPTTFKTNP